MKSKTFAMKYYAVLICLYIFNCQLYAQQTVVVDPQEDKIIYYCAPCGCADDGKYFSEPGMCQACPMPLQPMLKSLRSITTPINRPTVGMFLFNGADVMDVTGPISVFEHANFNIVTFSKTTDPVRIGMNLELKPEFTMAALPEVDVIVLPGGGLSESNPGDPEVVDFLKQRKDSTDVFLSVCSGAFFLGEAGLLDGKMATTFAALIPRLNEQYPQATVLNHVKYADNGQVVTSAGLSSGIDAAFQVVSKFYGMGRAQDIANHMEYPWDKENSYARSQLADGYLLGFRSLVAMFSTEYLYSAGDENNWEYRYKFTTQLKPSKMMKLIKTEIEKMVSWQTTASSNQSLSGTLDHTILGTGQIDIRFVDHGQTAIITARRIAKYSRITQ